jgi:hypothetical protein
VKPSSADEHRRHTTTLINAFLASATSTFGSLVSSSGAKWSVQIEHSTSKGLADVAPENVSGFFFVTASFANALVAGHISFGDRELTVNTVLGSASRSERYGLWEWADAVDQPALVPRNTDFVTTVNRIEEIVTAMATAVRTLQEVIAEVIERMDSARALVRERLQTSLREDEHRRAAAQAAEAFRARDFGRVVTILEQVEGLLTPAERDKLAYARGHS